MGERAWGRRHHHEACTVSLSTIVERGPNLNCACWPRRGAFLTEHPENVNLLCKVQNRIWGGLYLATLSQSSWVQPTLQLQDPSSGLQYLWWTVLSSILVGKSVLLGLPHCPLWVSAFSGLLNQKSGEGNGTPLSTLAWKIPWTEEPGRLQSMGSQRVGHDWATSFSLFTFMHWRRKWQPTPKEGGPGRLLSMGHTELDTTEPT